MLYYDRIDVSKGINVNKTSDSKECIFITIGRYHNSDIFNERHDLLIMCS